MDNHILFEIWLIMIFSSPERKLAKRTSVHGGVGGDNLHFFDIDGIFSPGFDIKTDGLTIITMAATAQ